MARFRLFLRNSQRRIVGRSDFNAVDKDSGLRIAHIIADACSDACAAYDVLQDGQLVASVATNAGQPETDLTEFELQVVVDLVIALHNSVWAVHDSKRLLETLKVLRA